MTSQLRRDHVVDVDRRDWRLELGGHEQFIRHGETGVEQTGEAVDVPRQRFGVWAPAEGFEVTGEGEQNYSKIVNQVHCDVTSRS